MAYCTLNDVKVFLPQRTFAGNDIPSANAMRETTVTSFISTVDSLINGALSFRGYITPVPATAVQSLLILKNISMHGVAALVERAILQTVDKNESTYAADLWSKFLEFLGALARKTFESGKLPPLLLVDAPFQTGYVEYPRSKREGMPRIFTELSLDDFVDLYKVSTPSEVEQIAASYADYRKNLT